MDDTVFKEKYEKCKYHVKNWEKEFKKKNSRVPSKLDIREAPKNVRIAYKMYYKMKTSFLENTLNEVFDEDGFDVFELKDINDDADTSVADFSMSGSYLHDDTVLGAPQLPMDISAIVDGSAATCAVVADAQNESTNDKEMRNTMLNDKNSKKDTRKPFKMNLNYELFKNTSFTLRNPRKPLPRNKAKKAYVEEVALDANGQPVEVLPDFETILARKAEKYRKESEAAAKSIFAGTSILKKEQLKTQVDHDWLQRNTGLNVTTTTTNDEREVGTTVTKKQSYGLSNIDLSKMSIDIQQKQQQQEQQQQQQQQEEEVVQQQQQQQQQNEIVSKSLATTNEEPNTSASAQLKSKTNKKSVIDAESDSDSVVSDSEDETQRVAYRHRVKRPRILTNKQDNNNQQQQQQMTILNSTASKISIEDDEVSVNTSFDFSADDDKDADYVMEKQKKFGKRKQITAKRSKTSTTKIQKSQKTSVAKIPKKPKATKTKSPKTPKISNNNKVDVHKTKRRTKKINSKGISDEQLLDTNVEQQLEAETETEQQPPDPTDLKYMLALDSSMNVTAVPRVKMSELAAVDDVAQKYINTVAVTSTHKTDSNNVVVNEKRAAARKKLEEKIATGKLNENYVRINIQKKKFVRGKSKMNFAKYKKKQWKHIKRIAALSGPNMDMGGCDGGVLTCFNCGGVGHFAQNCKIKGDSLLPLTAQLTEDPSPFPTLEEAAQMAAQSAIAVHSRNISKLPAAKNSIILETTENKEIDDKNEVIDKDFDEIPDTDDSTTDDENTLNNSGEEEEAEKEKEEEEEEIFLETDDELDNVALNSVSPVKQYAGHKIPEKFLREAGLIDENNEATTNSKINCSPFGNIAPIYDLNDDNTVKEVTPEVMTALHMFGHNSFRKGQDRAIMRILSGLSTLVTLSTGSGKSLCYQLPAYIYSKQKGAITLVISPLVSLMEDQVTGVPDFIRAHCLHMNQTPHHRAKVLNYIKNGEIDVLLVSPEAVVAGEKSTGFGAILRQLPPIAFACIDEAHCVSQWSHNFRPSYLMICKVLKKNLGVRVVLGLTATATLPTRMSIINHLGITDGERGIISDIPLPDNLILSVSKDENRDRALLQLLNSPRFELCQSIIIYCTRRDQCERIASFLRSWMQETSSTEQKSEKQQNNGKRKRKRVNWQAEPYHAGMAASRRRTIQNAFMRNELRIVVATIAFGMGINKSDIRAIIHYNMPRNFESYVQEIGRAGRDGKLAHCHLFLDAQGDDQNELRRHIFANSIDRHVIRKLLQHIFVPCSCVKNLNGNDISAQCTNKSRTKTTSNLDGNVDASDFGKQNEETASLARAHICPGHEIGFSVDKTVEILDIPAENIATLLCYMELDARWNMSVLSQAYIKAKVISYSGAKYLKYAAKECPPLAMAIALKIKQGDFKDDANIIEFSIVDIAAAIGWNSGIVKYQLKNLEWVQVNGRPKRSPITVSFYDLGFRLNAPGDFTEKEIDDALDTLYKRSVRQEETQLKQLQFIAHGLSLVSYNHYVHCSVENFSTNRSDQLKEIIRHYFINDYPKDLKLEDEPDSVPDQLIINDIHAMINMYPENNFSGRNLARIFHGIPSPNNPAVIWGRCKYWRAHSKSNFNRILQLANAVIISRRRS